MQVSFKSVEDIQTFVTIMEELPFNVILKSGRYIVDAKSILGICSLDLSGPVEVLMDSDGSVELFKEKVNSYRNKSSAPVG